MIGRFGFFGCVGRAGAAAIAMVFLLICLGVGMAVAFVGEHVQEKCAFADSTVYTEGALHYTIADESITITEYFGRDAEVYVPNLISGVPVNTIAAGAFYDTAATKVYLPDTIMMTEDGAFGGNVSVVFNYNTSSPIERTNKAISDGAQDVSESVDTDGNKIVSYTDEQGNGVRVVERADGSIVRETTFASGVVLTEELQGAFDGGSGADSGLSAGALTGIIGACVVVIVIACIVVVRLRRRRVKE